VCVCVCVCVCSGELCFNTESVLVCVVLSVKFAVRIIIEIYRVVNALSV
jgi:hypothetical protein